MKKVAAQYNEVLHDFLGLPSDKLSRHMAAVMKDSLHNCNVLEIASGKPGIAHLYAALGAKRVAFVDNDPRCFANTAENPLIETDILIEDILTWNTSEQFDAIHIGDNSIAVFSSFEAQRLLIAKAISLLAASGTLYLNIVPVAFERLRRFLAQLAYLDDYYIGEQRYALYGKADADYFFQKLRLHFALYKGSAVVYQNEIATRFITPGEIKDMVLAGGGSIQDVHTQTFGDATSIYYAIKKASSPVGFHEVSYPYNTA